MARLVAHTTALDTAQPLLDLAPVAAPLVWLGEAHEMVGWGEAARLEPGAGPDRFARAQAAWGQLASAVDVRDEVGVPGRGLVAVGSFTFDDRDHGSTLVVPAVLAGGDGRRRWLTRIGEDGGLDDLPGPAVMAPASAVTDRVRYAGSSQPDLHWLESVAAAVKRIDAGELDKVVLARDVAVWSRQPFDPRHLVRRLRARFPACFTFVVDGLVGASPELLVRRTGPVVESVALAGTAPRSADPDEDARLGRALLASPKDRREHRFAAASVAAVLSQRCPDLTHALEPSVLALDNVQHLATRFRGTLTAAESALSLAGALHPTAAVGGTPTDAAVRLIRELEGMTRGRYAGPVGWVGADGDGEWAIALRCAELSGARARLFAGNGIVTGSLPEDELEETRLKLRAMMSAFE